MKFTYKINKQNKLKLERKQEKMEGGKIEKESGRWKERKSGEEKERVGRENWERKSEFKTKDCQDALATDTSMLPFSCRIF